MAEKVGTSKKEVYNEPKLKITLVKSLNGRLEKQQKTCRALGLTKLNQTVIQRDNPAIRGIIFVFKHMVTVEEVK